ncbi:hypothetical protein IWQ62_001825 [Dispira parvispora]|uniref:SCP domain-containing protein n=1 Tax=Dispira parvispora TaxID=1520584 RepID=A0A9W8AY47_9FUNG|nr:hypothetical protein IWQ62_001825 [Dispira parvispora]
MLGKLLLALLVLTVAVQAYSNGYNRVLELVNQERGQAGVGPLSLDRSLISDAEQHSRYQAELGSITHNDKRGQGMDRLELLGVQIQFWAENVCYTSGGPDGAFDSWIRSPNHRENILNPQATHMGVGEANGYWTQVFARY